MNAARNQCIRLAGMFTDRQTETDRHIQTNSNEYINPPRFNEDVKSCYFKQFHLLYSFSGIYCLNTGIYCLNRHKNKMVDVFDFFF